MFFGHLRIVFEFITVHTFWHSKSLGFQISCNVFTMYHPAYAEWAKPQAVEWRRSVHCCYI